MWKALKRAAMGCAWAISLASAVLGVFDIGEDRGWWKLLFVPSHRLTSLIEAGGVTLVLWLAVIPAATLAYALAGFPHRDKWKLLPVFLILIMASSALGMFLASWFIDYKTDQMWALFRRMPTGDFVAMSAFSAGGSFIVLTVGLVLLRLQDYWRTRNLALGSSNR